MHCRVTVEDQHELGKQILLFINSRLNTRQIFLLNISRIYPHLNTCILFRAVLSVPNLGLTQVIFIIRYQVSPPSLLGTYMTNLSNKIAKQTGMSTINAPCTVILSCSHRLWHIRIFGACYLVYCCLGYLVVRLLRNATASR